MKLVGSNRRFGYRPPAPDSRDTSFVRFLAPHAATIPSGRADNSWQTIEVLDQGGLGSCVLNGIAQLIRADNARRYGGAPTLCSRLAAYYYTRVLQGDEEHDEGCDPRTAMKAYQKFGVCAEIYWPYIESMYRQCPSGEALRNSHDQRAYEYAWVQTGGSTRINDVKLLLDAGFQVGIGGGIGAEYGDWKLGDSPLGPPNKTLGGHFRVLEGYAGDVFSELGSWGTTLGDNGRVLISSDYIAWGGTTSLLVIRRAPEIHG